MKKRDREGQGNREKIEGSKSINMKSRNKNLKDKKKMRGLSLEAFANAKSKRNHYNPALIKKQREFYKNAKHVTKYRKSLKQQSQKSELSLAIRPYEDDAKPEDDSKMNRENKKSNKNFTLSLRELYEKTREEKEKERMEREAIIQAKKEEREKANARRNATRERLYKKKRSWQSIMKDRIEHLLESSQGASRDPAEGKH